MLSLIDAHTHFWDPEAHYYPWLNDPGFPPHRYGDHSTLKRPYLPADYRRDTAGVDLLGSVLMEAEWDPRDPVGEMRFIASLREQSGLPSVAIGQAWLQQHDAARTLEQLAAFDFVRGVRQKPRANPAPGGAPGGMTDAAWLAGYARLEPLGLHYELQTPWWHLPEAARVAGDFPGTRIVINQAGMPSDRSDEGLRAWRTALAGIAAQPNVAIKISGIGEAGGTVASGCQPACRAGGDRVVRRGTLHVRQQLPRGWPVCVLPEHLRWLCGMRLRLQRARAGAAVRRERAPLLSDVGLALGLLASRLAGTAPCARGRMPAALRYVTVNDYSDPG